VPQQARDNVRSTVGYPLLAAGALSAVASALLFAWNDRRHDTWQAKDAALDRLQQELLARRIEPRSDAELAAGAARNDERLASIRRFDVLTIVAAGLGAAALGAGAWVLFRDSEAPIGPQLSVTHNEVIGAWMGRW
jgi:hypothetical protein